MIISYNFFEIVFFLVLFLWYECRNACAYGIFYYATKVETSQRRYNRFKKICLQICYAQFKSEIINLGYQLNTL